MGSPHGAPPPDPAPVVPVPEPAPEPAPVVAEPVVPEVPEVDDEDDVPVARGSALIEEALNASLNN
jgi:hypothetical protein